MLEKDSWTGTDIYTRHTDYIDVTVENAFSPNGGVKIYHALLKSVNGRRTWTYEEVPAGETIRLSSPGDGYCGSASTYIPSWGRKPFCIRIYLRSRQRGEYYVGLPHHLWRKQ